MQEDGIHMQSGWVESCGDTATPAPRRRGTAREHSGIRAKFEIRGLMRICRGDLETARSCGVPLLSSAS